MNPKFDVNAKRVLPFRLAMHMLIQCQMNRIFNPLNRELLIILLDVIIIHRRYLEEQILHLWDVLTLLTGHRLKDKHVKCYWDWQRMNYCSFDSEKDGMYTQESKTCVVMDWPQPENCKTSGGFQGFSTYDREFINTTCTLQFCCTQMAPITEVNEMSGSNLVNQEWSGRLHLPGTQNASILSTPLTWDSAILKFLLYQTLKPSISCRSMLAIMRWV